MENESFTGINIIPLVDIMLVLITIVLITSNFMVRGLIPVNLPRSESAAADTIKEVISVGMTKDGLLYLQEEMVSLEELPFKLGAFDKGLPVIVSADRELTLQPFVSVVDTLKKTGFAKISIQTEQ